MNRYNITTELATDLTIEEVENLFEELINTKIGILISGKGEVIKDTKFNTIHNNICPNIDSNGGRPRCMYLNGDNICKAVNGCVYSN